MTPLNIMVVDDSLLGQRKLITMIEGLGHAVIKCAGTGAEAVQFYKDVNPDLVTMDITMPDMNGIEATKIIKEKYSDAKILMVTSHAQKSMVIDALDAGACGYLIKPIEIAKLEEAINRAMKL